MLFQAKNKKLTEAEEFVEACKTPLSEIYSAQKALESVKLSELVNENAALIIVDMINGFVKEGALASPNVLAINDTVAQLAKACESYAIPIAALADCHSLSSPEFTSFPTHCLANTEESEITAEILEACHPERIEKNSTNGYLSPKFREWMEHCQTSTYIIVGDCTDLCVMHLALTLKTHFNQLDKASRILIPTNAVATYSLGNHDAGLINTMSLYMMQTGGVELCSEIEY